MFYRKKFVTNSSSSSFIAWGVILSPEETKGLNLYDLIENDDTKDIGHETPGNYEQEVIYIREAYGSGPGQGADYVDSMGFKPEWEEKLAAFLTKHDIKPSSGPGWIVGAYNDNF